MPRPYAFLDDAPLEERRTQAVMSRRYADPDSADDLGRLDPAAIESVREQAWPEARNADEMHEALMGLGVRHRRRSARHATGTAGCDRLRRHHRAATRCCSGDGAGLWFAAERLPQVQALYPQARCAPPIEAPAEFAAQAWSREDAALELVRSRLTGLGPITADALGAHAGAAAQRYRHARCSRSRAKATSCAAASRRPRHGASQEEWCERHLLARIHRYTIGRLRREIEPVEPRDFMRFLFDWQHVSKRRARQRPGSAGGVLAQLEGFEAPAAAWESELLPARVSDYSIAWLDDLCTAGRVAWTRLRSATANADGSGRAAPVRATPIVLLPRRQLALWTRLTAGQREDEPALSSRAREGRRCPARTRRVVLRRTRRRRAPAAHRTGGRAGRTRRARPRALRQLRRPARAAGAAVQAPVAITRVAAGARRCSASRMRGAGR